MAKKYPCKQCGVEVIIRSKGLCPLCRKKEVGEKPRKAIKSLSPKRKTSSFENKIIMGEYFSHHLNLCRQSENSGVFISEPTRVNICHLLPKRIYKSVKDNIDNCIYLTQDEHTRFDYLLDTLNLDKIHQEMPVAYKILFERLEKILPLVQEKGKLLFKLEEEWLKNTK